MVKETKQTGVYWIEPYAKKTKDEFQAYQFCVIDGIKWGVRPNGSTYCAGPVEKTPVATPQTTTSVHQFDNKAVTNQKPIKDTTPPITWAKTSTDSCYTKKRYNGND